MNPLLQAALGSIIRWALAALAGILVSKGVWTQQDADTYITALVLAILSLGWSLWAKYKERIFRKKALEMPAGATEDEVKQAIRSDALLGK